MTQKERQERSKEEIYRAAMDEFGTRGYDGVNMEQICGSHGISKGMMYHYYSGKDDLFLLCADRTFRELTDHVEQGMDALEELAIPEAIKGFFMLREGFFQTRPKEKMVFESAMLRPPHHLTEQIQSLRAPLRQLNRRFIQRLADRMPLRPELESDKVSSYLAGIEPFFQDILNSFYENHPPQNLHTMLEASGELLNMVLFGVLRQSESGQFEARQSTNKSPGQLNSSSKNGQ